MIHSGRKTVATPGEPERLVDGSLLVSHLEIVALSGNSGNVWLGGESVSAMTDEEKGMSLDAEDVLTLPPGAAGSIDLRDIWIAAATADDGVTWLALS